MDDARGIAYGVGVGPGDPELMTLKACRLIRDNEVIAVPGKVPRESLAYRIAAGAVPELEDKELIGVVMPMVRDKAMLEESHRRAADLIESYLDKGKNVVYLTLGDPAVYCSFSYLMRILEADGYETEMVSGIPSFCAAAARLGISLAEKDEPLHIVPALHYIQEGIPEWPGNLVMMKHGGRMGEVREWLAETGLDVRAVENCGMENEKIYRSLEEIPDEAGYFSLLIAKRIKDD